MLETGADNVASKFIIENCKLLMNHDQAKYRLTEIF